MRVIFLLLVLFAPLLADVAEVIMEAQSASNSGDYKTAERILRAGLVQYPEDSRLTFELGLLLQGEKRYAEAVELYGRAQAHGNNEVELFYNRAQCLMEQGKFEVARQDIAQALKQKPHDPDALVVGALIETADGKKDAARIYLKDAQANYAGNLSILRSVAGAAERSTNYDIALSAVDVYLKARANDVMAQRLRARTLASLGRSKEALAAFQEISTKWGKVEDYESWFNLAEETSDYAEEVAAAKALYERFQNPAFLANLGIRGFTNGDYRRCIEALSMIETPSPDMLWNMALAWEKLGEIAEAKATWERYLASAAPESGKSKIRSHLKDLETSPTPPPPQKTELTAGDSPEGVAAGEAATKYYKQGDYAAALPLWLKAYELLPNRPELLYNYASTLEKLDRLADAETAWQRYLSTNINDKQKSEIDAHLASLRKEIQFRLDKAKEAEDNDKDNKKE